MDNVVEDGVGQGGISHPFSASSLPRLLFLINFWSQFYKAAKYGLEAGYLAPANDLFKKKEEADLAVQHAQECYQAAAYLRYFGERK